MGAQIERVGITTPKRWLILPWMAQDDVYVEWSFCSKECKQERGTLSLCLLQLIRG